MRDLEFEIFEISAEAGKTEEVSETEDCVSLYFWAVSLAMDCS